MRWTGWPAVGPRRGPSATGSRCRRLWPLRGGARPCRAARLNSLTAQGAAGTACGLRLKCRWRVALVVRSRRRHLSRRLESVSGVTAHSGSGAAARKCHASRSPNAAHKSSSARLKPLGGVERAKSAIARWLGAALKRSRKERRRPRGCDELKR